MPRFDIDPTSLSRETPMTFEGPAGPVQGLWRPAPAAAPARGVVVVAHPHPAYGGTMMNKVVFHTARTLNHDLALATLRFNFRGVGESAGAYDEGRGEMEDLRAAWREARRRQPEGVLVAAGFSFGAAMTLKLAAGDLPPALVPAALALLGIPMRLFPPPVPAGRGMPLAAVHGERDQFTSHEKVTAYLEAWPSVHAFHVVPEADHFFEGQLPEATSFLSRTLEAWLRGDATGGGPGNSA